MIEHRLIERMLKRVGVAVTQMELTQAPDTVMIDTVVDFIRVYADRTHHGKEEDILFRDLADKELDERERRTMLELIDEHKAARKMTAALVAAKQSYLGGQQGAIAEIVAQLKALTDFYPQHIRKEDVGFFIPVMRHFDRQEQADMISEMWEFDRKMIHEKYRAVVEELGG